MAKKSFFILFLLLIGVRLMSQSVFIYDQQTGEPVSNVFIFNDDNTATSLSNELGYAKLLCDNFQPDALLHHDDWGSHRSSFISPEMFEEFIVPAYKKIYGFYKANGVDIIVRSYKNVPGNSLRSISDDLKSNSKSGIFFLISSDDKNKLSLILSCTKNISSKGFHCGKLLSKIAKEYGGGGGGRPDMAQAGASKKIDLEDLIKKLKTFLEEK